jgi:hypothetical protein
MAAKSLDKILSGAALLVLLSSLAWTLTQGGKHGGPNGSLRSIGEPTPYVSADLKEFKVSTQLWALPLAQTSGNEWIYDVFTPPEIYYDLANKRFTVSIPKPTEVVIEPEVPFGVKLVHVKQDAFRLQLVGYTGKEGNYRGTFENMVNGKTILGQAGKKIPDLDLTIVSFEVNQNRTNQTAGNTVIIETEAVAQISDNKTGEIISLTNKSRLIKGTPIAYLRVDDEAREPGAYKVGAKFTVGDATFTVNSVSFDPTEVVVTKESPSLKEPVIKTLTGAAPSSVIPQATAPAPATPEVKTPAIASPIEL